MMDFVSGHFPVYWIWMVGVQNSRSPGLYGLRTIEKLNLHLWYEAGPIVNH